MIIKTIQLTNIGPYRGIHSINFETAENKNVILIGGENGSGKTTLLNSIKLGLFGAYAYGYKTANSEYLKKIGAIFNNHAKKIGDHNFRIKLEFTIVDELEKVDYVLYRSWRSINNSIHENLDILANGAHMNEYQKELFQSKLREIMPPQLLDLCLFDGEEISRIINEELLSQYLEKLSRVVFNLELFERLELDLENYTYQELDSASLSEKEMELIDLTKQERLLQKEYLALNERLQEFQNKKISLLDEYSSLKNDFEKYGGVIKTEREQIQKRISELEFTRKQNSEKIREFVSTLLPFYLSRNLLSEVREQINKEESLLLYRQLKEKLNNENLISILSGLNIPTTNEKKNYVKEQILSLILTDDQILQIHGSSFSESSLIENMYNLVYSDIRKEYLNIIEENKTFLSELQQLREKLKVNDSTNEFSNMINQMETIQNTIKELDNEINNCEITLLELNTSLEKVKISIDKISKIIKDNEKTKNSYIETQKIISLSRRFREVQIKKKLQEVQIEATKMLNKIIRKHNYISTILIEPDTYNVLLFDNQKERINKNTLSAGEKQILLLSIIWAIFKCSGRKVPFIFDTLLGRLDKTHKSSILNEFIPKCGRQAIILSTDTEIDKDHYKLLYPYISKEYTLEFNIKNKETKIHKRYFPFEKELSLK